MDNPDESIPKHQWSFIVATPLLQDGVDISTPGYFSEVFGIFGGVVSVNSVCQMVRRVRHPVKGIKILCAERGYQTPDGDGINVTEILLTFTKRLSNELLEHEGADIKDIIKRQWAAVMDDPHHLAWAELTAFANLERPHLYDLACELLKESGHEVYELDLEKAETTEHKLAKEEGRQERAEEGKMLVFASDHKTTSLVLQALKNLNIGQFLEPDGVWTNDSPEVLAVAEWGKSKKAKLIDKEIGERTPMQYLQDLLAVIGVKLIGNRKNSEKREYSYLPDGGSLPVDFSELYAAVSSKMLERYEEKVEKQNAKKRSAVTAETLASSSLELLHP
jgi:hypothetical protein